MASGAVIGAYGLTEPGAGLPTRAGPGRRPGAAAREVGRFRTDAVETLIAEGNTVHRARLVALIRDRQGAATVGDPGLDETLEAIREEMRKIRRERSAAPRP